MGIAKASPASPGLRLALCACLALWLVWPSAANAGKLEKGFERLRIHDYFRAKAYFNQSLRRWPAGAAYGLSVIYSRNNNPFYNLDSARRYILVCDTAFRKVKGKRLDKYNKLGITDFSIIALTDTICRKAFYAARLASSVNGYNRYLGDFSFCTHVSEAADLRNEVAFHHARLINTSAAYLEFMEKYSKAKEHHEANARYEEKLFEERTVNGKLGDYELFIRDYPESPFVMNAEKRIFEISTRDSTVEAYHAFIMKYPDNTHVPEAWRALYALSTRDYTEAAFGKFRRDFPDYPFMDELEKDFRLQQSLLLPFRDSGKWGYIDETGRVLIEPRFEDASLFSEGLAYAALNGKYGYISKSGKTVIPFELDEAETFHEQTAVAVKDDRWGLINRYNEVLVPFEYDEISPPSENICVVTLNDRSAYLALTGKRLTGFDFDIAGDFDNGFAIAGSDNKYGVISSAGHFVIEPRYAHLSFLSNGFIKARGGDRWGIISLAGDTLLPFEYEAIGDYSEGLALVAKNRKCGFIDERGRLAIPPVHPFSDYILNNAAFSDGYVLLRQKTRATLLDTAGKKVSFRGVRELGQPSEGLIPARRGRLWGYVSYKGKTMIKDYYESAGPFRNGRATVTSGGLSGVIDTTGKLVILPVYDRVLFQSDFVLTILNGLYGLVAFSGKPVLDNKFDRIEFIEGRAAMAYMDDRRYYVNLEAGKVVFTDN